MTVINSDRLFCGKQFEETALTLVRLRRNREQERQTWFSHAACFRERLTDLPEMPGFFEPAHF